MVPYIHKRPALEIIQSKIYPRETLEKLLEVWRFKGHKLVFTNGCFDILHLGHIDYLANASDLGDELIVGLNSDASVKKLGKGNSRPLQDEVSRAKIIASLHFVSAVVLFNETTPQNIIEFVNPDILVKGADYDADETDPTHKKFIVGSDFVRSHKGLVKTLPFLQGFSTSAIEQKIRTQ